MLQKDFVPGQRIWVEMTIFPTVATRINRLDVSTQRKFQSSKALNWFYFGTFSLSFLDMKCRFGYQDMKPVWIGAEENAGQQMIRLSDVSARFSLKNYKIPRRWCSSLFLLRWKLNSNRELPPKSFMKLKIHTLVLLVYSVKWYHFKQSSVLSFCMPW